MQNNTLDIIPHVCYSSNMKYLTTKEIAEKWGISDRRVRVFCRDGRIDGAIEQDGRYLVPEDAKKPEDRRRRSSDREFVRYGEAYLNSPVNGNSGSFGTAEEVTQYRAVRIILFLKWADDVIADIDENYNVNFTEPEYNEVVESYTAGKRVWSREEFEAFLAGRIVGRDRRDIERILFRCGLSSYDTIRVGIATHSMNARDLLWITDDSKQSMQDAMTDVFGSIFLDRIDAEGDSIDTPEGYNIKRYGVFNGNYGIYKKRLHPLATDVESELAVCGIAKLMGVPCCKAERTDEDTVFSVFEYDFAREYIVHMRRLFETVPRRGDDEYRNLLAVRPEYQADFVRMIALDFVTRQDDRHLSNIAVKIGDEGESFYPLYDNGRSLFYEDSEETAERACSDIRLYATSFGPTGSYYDYVEEISDSGIQFSRLVNLDISDKDIAKVLKDAGFESYRLDASEKWIAAALDILRQLKSNM